MSRMRNRFDINAALKTAHGFHGAAGRLEYAGDQLSADIRNAGRIDIEMITQIMGNGAGAVVLEALAVELILKVRLHRSGKGVPQGHDHFKLFAQLSDDEKRDAEHQYSLRRLPPMRTTLADVFAFSADVFVKWRYLHEHGTVEASLGEMQRAFAALAHGIPIV